MRTKRRRRWFVPKAEARERVVAAIEADHHYARRIARHADLSGGSTYVALIQLENAGTITARRDDPSNPEHPRIAYHLVR